MEFLLDTVDLKKIKYYCDKLNVKGVTSNPTILKKDGVGDDLFAHLKKIKEIIGDERELHVQVVAPSVSGMIDEAHKIIDEVGKDVYIKVSTTLDGLEVMKKLKAEGIRVTATAIYTEFQGYQAINVGADYLAPYYNRMLNQNIDSAEVIRNLAKRINLDNSNTKILAASFHNVAQVNEALSNGAQAVTVGPDIVASAFKMPSISQAVADFRNDWESLYGDKNINNL